MRRLLWITPLFLTLVAGSAWANLADEVIILAQNNVSEDVMMAFVNENPGGVSRLSANDIVRLKEAGVTDRVINALILRMGAAPPAGENQAATPPVYAQQPPQTAPVVVTTPAPPAPVYDCTYYVDTSYPVPIYCDYPAFPFGVDILAQPWWHHCLRFGFGSAPPCFWGHRSFVISRTSGFAFDRRLFGSGRFGTRTGFAASALAPARGTLAAAAGGRPARGTMASASQNLARTSVANRRSSQVQSPVLRRTEPARTHQSNSIASSRSQSFASRSYHSYSAPSYRSYSAPSYHSYSAPSYHSYAAPRSYSSGGGSYHSYGGGSHSFGGGGFHGGFGGGGHHR